MSLFNFVARSTLSPLQSMLNEEIFKVNTKLQNSVDDFFAKGLKKLGLSSAITSQLSARFSDALVQDLADSFFQSATTEINRVTRGDIVDNIRPRGSVDTSFNVESRVKNNIKVGDINAPPQYPSHLGEYYSVFEFYDYNRERALDQGTLELRSAVVLPLPRRLEEQIGININPEQIGAGSGLTTNVKSAINNVMAGNNNAAFEDFKKAGMIIATPAAYKAITNLASGVGEKIVPGTNFGALVGQELGAVVNPFLSAVFSGVDLRTFSFDWRINPRNPEESAKVKEIIKQFKLNSLPSYTKGITGQNLLTYPSLCLVKLYPWANEKNNELIKFKYALIQNVSINYADAGVPSFFAGTKLPTFISLSISMLETSVFTAEDYDPSFKRDALIDKLSEKAVKYGEQVVAFGADKAKEFIDSFNKKETKSDAGNNN